MTLFQVFFAQAADRGDRARTCDLRFWRPTLYQLSYAPRLDEFTGRVRDGSSAERVPSRSSTTRPSSSSSSSAALATSAARPVARARASRRRGRRRSSAQRTPRRRRSGARAGRHRLDLDAQGVEDVGGAADRGRAGSQERQRAAAELEPRRARDGQDVAADRERVVGRDQRARAARRLDHHRGLGERRDDAVAHGEAPRRRLDARPPLRDDHARRRRCARRARRCAWGSRGRCRSPARRPCARRRRARPRARPRRCRARGR